MSEIERYRYDYQFERKLAWLCIRSAGFLERVANQGILDPNRVYDRLCRWVVGHSINYQTHYGHPPDVADLFQIAAEDERIKHDDRERILRFLNDPPDRIQGEGIVLDRLAEFQRHNRIQRLLETSADAIERGQYDAVERMWQGFIDERPATRGVDMRPFSQMFDSALERETMENAVPTLVAELDQYLFGFGIVPGDLAVWLAYTSLGKSTALAHVIKAGLLTRPRENILLVTFELSQEKYIYKIGQTMAAMTNEEIRDNPFVFRQRIFDKYKQTLDRLFIWHYPERSITVTDLVHMVRGFVMQSERPVSMVVVDYLDHLALLPQYGNDRLGGEKYNYEYFRGAMQELETRGWTACQANRLARDQAIVTMDHTADSFGKVRTADIVIGLGREPGDEGEDIRTMFGTVAKNRNEVSGKTVKWKTNYTRQQFVWNPDFGRGELVGETKEQQKLFEPDQYAPDDRNWDGSEW